MRCARLSASPNAWPRPTRTCSSPANQARARMRSLLLDEITHLTSDAQAKLLRVIETREFERLGGRKTIEVDARLITLTNADLKNAVERRAFRDDLFYRLNVVQIAVPPLRDRKQDLETLSDRFVHAYAEKHGRAAKRLSTDTRRLLSAYEFPGNVREL